MRHKIGNSWKLLLTAATELCLKCDRALTCSNSAKKTIEPCQIYSKLTTKTPEQHLVLLLITLNIFRTLYYCYYCWVWTNKCQLGLRNYSFSQLVCFQNCEKYIVLWVGKICWATYVQNCSPKMRLRKDIFSRQGFKKISRTLVTVGYIMFYGLGKSDCWSTSFQPHLPYIRLWKNNFLQRPFQKISRTLFNIHQREIFY